MPARFPAIMLYQRPRVYMGSIPGQWLLRNTTPMWRIENPETGFQRMVTERRAREIAAAVLAQKRGFPNAIVLATDSDALTLGDCELSIPDGVRFLVVDGQHRLWAQKFSDFEAHYSCVIHVGLSEPRMAALFVEINDNQKRVPSSLRWDLVRFVRPEKDPLGVRASELVEGLNSERGSPLFQRIDLTGEQPQITIKQGSLAPEIKILVNKKTVLRDEGFDIQLETLIKFFSAVKEKDPVGWREAKGRLYGNRVFRALIKLLPRVLQTLGRQGPEITQADFLRFLRRIRLDTLSDYRLRLAYGNAGIAAIAKTIEGQIFR